MLRLPCPLMTVIRVLEEGHFLESPPHGHKISLPHFTMSNPPEVEVVSFAVNPLSALSCVGHLQGVLTAM